MMPIGPAAMKDRFFIEWDKDDLDTLAIMKVDVLALGMLTCIRKAFALLAARGIPVTDLAAVPREDPVTYDMLCRGDSVGVFQVESRAQMNMLPRLRPREFYDADIVALHDFAAMAQAELAAPPFDSIDELTQLANRRGFEALADIALTWCRRRKRPATLLEFELERYHAIKATLGYAHGNRLLGAFAFNLKNSFRESDVLARVAENQFAVLTIDCGLRAVATLCNRLEESVEKYNHRAQPGTGISFSVGIARFDTDGDDDIGGLMTLAGAEVFRCREARSHSPRRGLVSAGHN